MKWDEDALFLYFLLYRYNHNGFQLLIFIDDSNSENEGQLRLVDGRDESEVHFRLY